MGTLKIGQYDVEQIRVVVFCLWICIYAPCNLFSSYLLFKYRNRYNIAARGPTVMLVGQTLALLTFMFFNSLSLFPTPSCGLYAGLVGMHLNVLAVLFALRCWVLMFRSRIAVKLAEYSLAKTAAASSGQPLDGANSPERLLLEGPGSWFIRHREWMLAPFVRKVYISVIIPLLLIPVVIISFVNWSCDTRILRVSFYDATTVGVWAFVILVLSAMVYRQERDAFGIKAEFSFAAGVAVVVTIIEGALSLQWNDTILAICVLNTGIVLGWMGITVKPLVDARKYTDDVVNFAGIRDVATLEDLLGIDIGFQSFMDYSKREFAQENVLFWKAVQEFHDKYGRSDYRALMQREQCMQTASTIMKQFIVDNAPSQVNLPAGVRENLIKAFEEERAKNVSVPAVSHSRQNTLNSPINILAAAAPSDDVNSRVDASANNNNNNNNNNIPSPGSNASIPVATAMLSDRVPLDGNRVLTSEGESRLIAALDGIRKQDADAAVTLTHSVVAIFSPAVKEVYQLMTTDLLPRYVRSREFATFVQKMKDRAEANASHTSREKKSEERKSKKKSSKKSKETKSKSKSKSKPKESKQTKQERIPLRSPSSSAPASTVEPIQGIEMNIQSDGNSKQAINSPESSVGPYDDDEEEDENDGNSIKVQRRGTHSKGNGSASMGDLDPRGSETTPGTPHESSPSPGRTGSIVARLSTPSTPTHKVRVSLTLGLTAKPLTQDLVNLQDVVVDPLSGSITQLSNSPATADQP